MKSTNDGSGSRRPSSNSARSGVIGDAGLCHTGPSEGVVLVDLSFKPFACDHGGEAILREINEHHGNKASAVCLPREIEVMLGSKSCLHLSAGDFQYECRAFLMDPKNGSGAQQLLALHLRRELSAPEAVRRVARAYHLTDREQEAVVGVSMGLTSKELGDRMNISPNTVNTFLRLIMLKMAVTTRAGIVGRLLEDSGALSDDLT